MEIIKVSSLPLKEVISDIAREFGVTFQSECGIFTVDIPQRLGSGTITGSDFEGGLGLIRYDCMFNTDLTFEHTLDRVHPVKFLFCLEGEIGHNFSNESTWHQIPRHRNAVVASSSNHGHRVRFRANERTVFTSLELERKSFRTKIKCTPNSIVKSWSDMLNDLAAEKTFYHDGFYSLRVSELFKEWDHYEDSNFLKYLYLEGLASKILVVQITQFQDDIRSEGKRTLLRQAELNQMMRAINIIDERLEDMPTIRNIALEVGLSAVKLQQGFKELYGKTANKYVKEKRLETAKTLLLKTDETISNISRLVGIKSVSYFSKVFLDAYGILPSEFQKNRERKKVQPGNLEE